MWKELNWYSYIQSLQLPYYEKQKYPYACLICQSHFFCMHHLSESEEHTALEVLMPQRALASQVSDNT